MESGCHLRASRPRLLKASCMTAKWVLPRWLPSVERERGLPTGGIGHAAVALKRQPLSELAAWRPPDASSLYLRPRTIRIIAEEQNDRAASPSASRRAGGTPPATARGPLVGCRTAPMAKRSPAGSKRGWKGGACGAALARSGMCRRNQRARLNQRSGRGLSRHSGRCRRHLVFGRRHGDFQRLLGVSLPFGGLIDHRAMAGHERGKDTNGEHGADGGAGVACPSMR
jgi:hypothetical protein